jgi:hypothetical protein
VIQTYFVVVTICNWCQHFLEVYLCASVLSFISLIVVFKHRLLTSIYLSYFITELYLPVNRPIVIHLPFDNSQPAEVVPFEEQEFFESA